MRDIVFKSIDVPPGSMKSTQLGPMPVVVIRSKRGDLRAYVDRCLHMGAPLSKGELTWCFAKTRQVGEYKVERNGEILRCPWHGYEYDVRTGSTIFDATRRLRSIRVFEIDGNIVLES